MPARVLTVATLDQWVSFVRSSNGKSNKVASIWVVSSTDTRSTQSNVTPRGRSSRIRLTRSRMVAERLARFMGATIGATILRCSSCFGGSIEMKLGRRKSIGRSRSTMPPIMASDEKAL